MTQVKHKHAKHKVNDYKNLNLNTHLVKKEDGGYMLTAYLDIIERWIRSTFNIPLKAPIER